jgi:transcriptional regulator with XRE-family HTH domain
MSTQRQVSENVEILLRRAGMRQEDLADALHLNRVSVSQRITGRTMWRTDELDGAAAFFGVTVSELVGQLPDFQEWDQRRRPATAPLGPRYFVQPESDLSTPPLSQLRRDNGHYVITYPWSTPGNHTRVVPRRARLVLSLESAPC